MPMNVKHWLRLPGRGLLITLLTALAFVVSLAGAPHAPVHASTTGGTLIWGDDFNGNSVDTSKWTVHDGGPSFTNNDWTTANNVSVQNNTMTLKADAVALGGKNYTSAWVDTLGKFAFLYGRVEIRAQLPQGGPGIWPALWALPNDGHSWPPEIDLWDNPQDMTTMVSRNIYGPTGGQRAEDDITRGGVTPGYHVFAFDWEPGSLSYMLDGTVIKTLTDHVPSTPMFLLMDLVIGWNLPTASTVFPQYFNINSVHVYQNAQNAPVTGNVENNLVHNGYFEADAPNPVQTPSGWFTTGDASASSLENQNCDCGREWNLKQYSPNPYQVYDGQTISGLSNGFYTATATVSSSGGQNAAYMEVKDDGGPPMQFPITSTTSLAVLSNIAVTNGQATLGFYSDANGGNWLRVDNVRFYAEASTTNALGDPGFENQTGNTVVAPWGTEGAAGTVGIDDNNGKAYDGQNDAYIGNAAPNTWNEIDQSTTLLGYSTYGLSCWVRTVGDPWPGGYVGIISADGSVQYSQSFGTEGNYTLVSIPAFNTGSIIDWKVFIGYHGGYTTWAQIDDCSLNTLPPNVLQDPGFEGQSSATVSAPWGTEGNAGAVGIDYHQGSAKAYDGQNDAYIGNAPSQTWSEVDQNVTLASNTTYVLGCWVRTVGDPWPGGYIGTISADGSIQYSQSFGTEANYAWIHVPIFNTGGNTSWKVFIGYWGGTNTWAQIDDCTLMSD